MANFTQNPKLTGRYRRALIFAFDAHQLQVRKVGEVAYFGHLEETSALLIEAGATEDQAIAGLLHDAIEDVGVTREALETHFGDEVARIVANCSADSHEEYLEQMHKAVEEGDTGTLWVSAADKLSNLRSYATTGRDLWKAKHQLFFETLILEIYSGMIPSHWEFQLDSLMAQAAIHEECNTDQAFWRNELTYYMNNPGV